MTYWIIIHNIADITSAYHSSVSLVLHPVRRRLDLTESISRPRIAAPCTRSI